MAILTGHQEVVMSVDFSADGSLIASGSSDRTIKLWDTDTRRCMRTINAHQDSFVSVAFDARSNLLASGSHDETVKLWNMQTGECLQVFQARSMYADMNIKGVTGVSEAQKVILKTLGSVD